MSYTTTKCVTFPGETGLSTVGYTIYNSSGVIVADRTTDGVSEITGANGIYVAAVTPPDENEDVIVWDDGGSPANFVVDTIAPPASGGGSVTVSGYDSGQDPATLVLGAEASDWDTAGTIGAKVNSAGSSGDPWSTDLPGDYETGTAGAKINTIWQFAGESIEFVPATGELTNYDPDGNAISPTRTVVTDAAGNVVSRK